MTSQGSVLQPATARCPGPFRGVQPCFRAVIARNVTVAGRSKSEFTYPNQRFLRVPHHSSLKNLQCSLDKFFSVGM